MERPQIKPHNIDVAVNVITKELIDIAVGCIIAIASDEAYDGCQHRG